MIALLFLAGITLWVTLAIVLARHIPDWLGVGKHERLLSIVGFCLILIVPMADE